MAQGESELGLAAYRVYALKCDPIGLGNRVDTEVGELLVLNVSPLRFDRVGFWCGGGKPLNSKPSSLVRKERLHCSAAMTRQPVPDQRDLCTIELDMEPRMNSIRCSSL